ncbi:MAG TPA: helix-turn-helix domain-containing protein [Candidatus Wallbacteria bacterium]|nr:helix-turn-helix domain-containing protein [Candidatus Wallbacteria bacterium]
MIKRDFIEPGDKLKDYIEYFVYSEFNFPDEPFNYVLRPDGYTELLIQNTAFSEYKLNERGYVTPDRCFILGQTKKAIMANYGSGYRYLVKFKPWGAHYFLNAPMNLFTDKIISLETALGRYGREMGERVLNAPDKTAAVNILRDMLEKRIAHNVSMKRKNDDENLIETVKKIIDSKRITRVMELLDSSYYGKRHLSRKFNAIIGLNPKTFIKIIRLNLCLENIHSKKKVSPELLLSEYGYYDRSHMVREFKEILKLTPTSYLSEYLHVIDNIIGYEASS